MSTLADRQKDIADIGREVRTPQELWEAYELLAYLEESLVAAGRRLHLKGHSWSALAAPFGLTRQAARKRWMPTTTTQFTVGQRVQANEYIQYANVDIHPGNEGTVREVDDTVLLVEWDGGYTGITSRLAVTRL